jgi:hypothetical protein
VRRGDKHEFRNSRQRRTPSCYAVQIAQAMGKGKSTAGAKPAAQSRKSANERKSRCEAALPISILPRRGCTPSIMRRLPMPISEILRQRSARPQ